MSLIKWFNGKYLLQNLKKSKGLLTLLVLIIPIITTLIIVSINASIFEVVVDEITLSYANLIGMYIIPFIISVIVGGYVYKRNSVDFINSMPMNRKTIFFTNFIAGVLIIFAIQVLTLITNLVCASIFTELFIPIGMIIDSFIVMLISYIFVFSASMLAMTVTGNVLTQIVVTLLILFLIPFSYTTFTIFQTTDLEISFLGGTTELSLISDFDTYTLPFKLVTAVFGSLFLYNEVSMAKMIVLSVLYVVIGIYLFEKRKMENVGTSFVYLKSHYIVKGLTIVPMIFMLCKADANSIYLGIGLTLIAVYYVIYDFIVSKKVKLKNTVIGFVVTVVLLFGVYNVGENVFKQPENQTVSINDIKGISMTHLYNRNEKIYMDRTLDIMIQDRNVIDNIISNIYGQTSTFREMAEVKSLDIDTSYNKINTTIPVVVKIKLNNSKEVYAYAYIDEDVYNDTITYLKSHTDYSETFKYKELTAAINTQILPKEDVDKIKEILEKRDYNLKNGLYSINTQTVQICAYDNHAMKKIEVDIGLTKDLFDLITKRANELSKVGLDTVGDRNNIYCSIEKLKLNGEREFDRDYIYIDGSARLLNYIKNHYEEEVNLNKEFICITFHTYKQFDFYINTNDEIMQIIKDSGVKWDSEVEDTEVTGLKQ